MPQPLARHTPCVRSSWPAGQMARVQAASCLHATFSCEAERQRDTSFFLNRCAWMSSQGTVFHRHHTLHMLESQWPRHVLAHHMLESQWSWVADSTLEQPHPM